MNTKHYTSIEQSKKLLELGLNPESADMLYQSLTGDTYPEVIRVNLSSKHWGILYPDTYIPCWSLGALLELMPETIILDEHVAFGKLKRVNAIWNVYYESNFSYREEDSSELIKAVYSMICWLLEFGYINKEK